MKSSDYLESTFFGLDHRTMRNIHAVIDTGAGPNLVRSGVLLLRWSDSLFTSARLPCSGKSKGQTPSAIRNGRSPPLARQLKLPHSVHSHQ